MLGVLAAAQEPLTPGAVRARLMVPLAYTTVMTALTRLLAKGAVTRQRCGRAYAYRRADPAAAAARQMVGVLGRGDDRAVVLAHFLEELDPDDVPVLQRLLSEAGGEPGPEPGAGGG